jgi:hypothetical protein
VDSVNHVEVAACLPEEGSGAPAVSGPVLGVNRYVLLGYHAVTSLLPSTRTPVAGDESTCIFPRAVLRGDLVTGARTGAVLESHLRSNGAGKVDRMRQRNPIVPV